MSGQLTNDSLTIIFSGDGQLGNGNPLDTQNAIHVIIEGYSSISDNAFNGIRFFIFS